MELFNIVLFLVTFVFSLSLVAIFGDAVRRERMQHRLEQEELERQRQIVGMARELPHTKPKRGRGRPRKNAAQ